MPETSKELAAVRTGLELTQAAMAKRLGVSLRTYIRWEHGEIEPRASVLELARRWVADARAKARPAGRPRR